MTPDKIAKQLPVAAVAALQRQMLMPGADPRRALAAALAAWPGAWSEDARLLGAGAGPHLILPLQETQPEDDGQSDEAQE